MGQDRPLRRHVQDAVRRPRRPVRRQDAQRRRALFGGTRGAPRRRPHHAEAETDNYLVEVAQKVVVVADDSKLGVVALARIIPLSRVDVFITDWKAPRETLREIELSGPEIVVAEPSTL